MTYFSLKTLPYRMREQIVVTLWPSPPEYVIARVLDLAAHHPTETVRTEVDGVVQLQLFFDKARAERRYQLIKLALHRTGWARCPEAFDYAEDAEACWQCDVPAGATHG